MAQPSRMSRNSKKGTAGKWELPAKPLAAALGYFIMGWSRIDGMMEVAIVKELGLGALDGSTVTAGLQFRGRSEILLSLLNRDPIKNKTAIHVVKDMQNLSERNDILHSVMGKSPSAISFYRRRTNGRFTSKIERYDEERLLRLTLRCSGLADQLQHALEIRTDDYLSFFHTSHNAANSD
jgi:hypothetical protein